MRQNFVHKTLNVPHRELHACTLIHSVHGGDFFADVGHDLLAQVAVGFEVVLQHQVELDEVCLMLVEFVHFDLLNVALDLQIPGRLIFGPVAVEE